MSRYFKVNRMFLSGKGKNIFKQHQVITSNQVHNLDNLIADGSLIPCDENGNVLEEEMIENVVNNDSGDNKPAITEADSLADLNGEPRPDNPGADLVEPKEATTEPKPLYSFVDKKGETVVVTTFDESTVVSLRAELKRLKIMFNPLADKNELFTILSENKK